MDKYLELKKEPRQIFLKKLGEAKYLPDELFVRLKKFKNQFGYVKDKNYSSATAFDKLKHKIGPAP